MRGIRVLSGASLAVAVACSTFGSTNGDPTAADGGAGDGQTTTDGATPPPAPPPPPPPPGSDDAGPRTSPDASVGCQSPPTCSFPELCCIRDLTSNYCEDGGASACEQNGGGSPVGCDEGSDCIGGAVCCARTNGDFFVGSGCSATCSGSGSYVICGLGSTDPCPPGTQCRPFRQDGGQIWRNNPSLFACAP